MSNNTMKLRLTGELFTEREMLCKFCNTNKLRKEFPSKSISPYCRHAPLHCLRCVTEHVEKFNQCSKCGEEVTEDSLRYLACVSLLKHLFPPLEAPDGLCAEGAEYGLFDNNATIRVVTLGGEERDIRFSPGRQIQAVKADIENDFGVEPEKQRLLFNEKELESFSKLSVRMTLKDYGVQANSTLLLIKVLQKIPESFDHVIFDFSFGFPSRYRKDYLDASALLYSGREFIQHVDFRTPLSRWSEAYGAVTHSGYDKGYSNERGNQIINVYLKKMPRSIDKVFFTLSSWNSPSIASYDTPSLHFYDARHPGTQLCSDRMSHAIHQQAIIMCSLCRVHGQWRVFSLGKASYGNTKRENYCHLQSTIGRIIAQGLC